MQITLTRFISSSTGTIGTLAINGKGKCFTLEDAYHAEKILGHTRIPSGNYEIKLRDEGGMTKKYANKFPELHRGMLWLQDVPNFEWVYIHIGNTVADTEGCILVGSSADIRKDFVGTSKLTYEGLYREITDVIDLERVMIQIIDEILA